MLCVATTFGSARSLMSTATMCCCGWLASEIGSAVPIHTVRVSHDTVTLWMLCGTSNVVISFGLRQSVAS